MIKAPAGTRVYAAGPMSNHRAGDLLFTITPQSNDTTIAFD